MSLNKEELLLQEAYNEVYREKPNYEQKIEEIVNLFKQKGWQASVITKSYVTEGPNDPKKGGANDGIAYKVGDEHQKYDVYFYAYPEKKSINFSAYVVMPWTETENEFNIPFAQAHDDTINTSKAQIEYSVPIDSSLEEEIDIIIDQINAFKLPEGPTSDEISDHKYFSKSDINLDL